MSRALKCDVDNTCESKVTTNLQGPYQSRAILSQLPEALERQK